jgi:hypothetical protein
VVPTTSNQSRRSQGNSSSDSERNGPAVRQPDPIKGIRLRVALADIRPEQVATLAQEEGIAVAKSRTGELTVAFTASTPEDALAKLKLISGVLSPRKG